MSRNWRLQLDRLVDQLKMENKNQKGCVNAFLKQFLGEKIFCSNSYCFL